MVSQDEVVELARSMAENLVRGPSYALEVTKMALNQEASLDLVTALEAEAEAQVKCMLNPNFREAYEAFSEKREARFE